MAYSFRKDPDRKKKLAAIFILVLFLGSSIAIALIDALNFGIKRNQDQDFPDKVNYNDISDSSKEFLITQGGLLITYNYPLSCADCNSTSQALIQFIGDKPDAFLVLLSGGENETIEMITYDNAKTVQPGNATELIDAYCSITYYPYDECIARKI